MNDFCDQNDLSENGLRRREEILQSAKQAARHRRWKRQTAHAGALAAMVVVVLFVTAPFWRPTPAPIAIVPMPASEPVHPIMAHTPVPEVIVKRFETDPTLLQRLSVPRQKPTWKTISDDDLLKELANAGHPAGLDYSNDGPVVVLYRNPNP